MVIFVVCNYIVDINQLSRDVRKTKRFAFAVGTTKNLHIQWKSYFMFCVKFDFEPLPLDNSVLCCYAQFLSRSFKSVQAVRNYISGVYCLSRLLELPIPEGNFEIKLFFKGLLRYKQHCPRQALPITPELLKGIFALINWDSPVEVSLWTCFLFAFFLMARKSNLVSDSISSFDKSKQLLRRDVSVVGSVLFVKIKWSKTNQFGSRVLIIPLVEKPDSCLCPVRAYKRMCELVVVPINAPAFCWLQGKHLKPLTYRFFQTKLRSYLEKLGVNSSAFSSHSFRRGGATWAFKCGVIPDLIQMHGDWKSDAYKQYLHVPLEVRLSVSQSMMGSL